MKWEPWEEFKLEFEDTQPSLPIEAPPCSNCKFWKPVREFSFYSGKMNFDGVKLCHAEDMYSDFSCYKERTNEK